MSTSFKHFRLTTPRDNHMAVEHDHIAEARTVLNEQYERGYEAGRLLGRLESIGLMALSALAAVAVWWLVVGR